MARASYTEAERRVALDLYEAGGARYAASETGIPRGTIQSWANRQGLTGQRTAAAVAQAEAQAASWSKRRTALGDELAGDIDTARAAYLDAMRRGKASDARTYGILFGVLIDKADKLTGADRLPDPARSEADQAAAMASVEALLDDLTREQAPDRERDQQALIEYGRALERGENPERPMLYYG